MMKFKVVYIIVEEIGWLVDEVVIECFGSFWDFDDV